MSVDAVVFDIGNVLLHWNPEAMYDRAIGAERRAALFEAVDLGKMNLDVDRGAPFRARIAEEAARHPDWSDEIMLWHDNWLEMASPAIHQSVRLLRALRAKDVPVFALTNFGVDTFALAARHYPFLGEFDRRYVSGHLGMIKPDPEIYAIVEDDSGVTPARLLFTDDRPENVAEAADRGWQTHLFQTPQGWADRLVAVGLLRAEESS